MSRVKTIEETKWLLARGTNDLTTRAQEAVEMAKGTQRVRRMLDEQIAAEDRPLVRKVELVLRECPLSIRQVARAVHAPVGRVTDAVRAMREAHLLVNVGTDDHPEWLFRVGDDASTHELRAMVRCLITRRPMNYAEIALATGARVGRVTSAVTYLRREDDDRMIHVDDRWFLRRVAR